MIVPRKAYSLLFKRYGPRGWWPVTPSGAPSPRYHPRKYELPGPRGTLEICLGAILTQNTAWTNVVTALEKIQDEKGMKLKKIFDVRPTTLQSRIRSSGYFVQKTKKLKNFVRFALARNIPLTRWLRATPLAGLREELLSINGVGPETADSMLLYAGGRKVFVVDAYTKRIGSRLGWFEANASYDEVQTYLEARTPRSIRVYQEFHALFVELGKRCCRPKPRCGECPLRTACPAGKRNLN